MTTLKEMISAKFEVNTDELKSQFRYAAFPDADKESLITLHADVACYGFEVGLDAYKSEVVREVLPLLLECLNKFEQIDNTTSEEIVGEIVDEALERLRKWSEGK